MAVARESPDRIPQAALRDFQGGQLVAKMARERDLAIGNLAKITNRNKTLFEAAPQDGQGGQATSDPR